ncbi:MAG: Tol-Pal system beta propeller repeat protein TolB [Burkholderiaceae bacterium]|jgi:TolB protein|nr:Tol-Pal system beta propeller repeat protein TolB [Burkholderiaceae bacterium]
MTHSEPSISFSVANRRRRKLLAAPLLFLPLSALAQFRVEISGVGMTQLPIAITPFRGETGSPQVISHIVSADLERSGQFRIVAPDGAAAMDETTRPDVSVWRQRGADSLAGGSINALGGGRYDVRFRLWDVVKDADLGGQDYMVPQADLRLAAHKIADYIYEKLTGEKGVFSTRLAYVTRAGDRYTLWVADADGENAQPAFSSPESIISPAWSPDGRSIAYVSFESRKPVVYVQNIASGRRQLLANFKGSNSAPTWSPDGRTLAVTLSLAGGSQLYLISAGGGRPQRITQSQSIDTEPRFSPNGQQIYFVSDRGGSPQIYRMPAGGGSAQRVTFEGNYNVSPALSPDGRWMAYITRSGGDYQLRVMDLSSGQINALTNTADDASPSFAPNSRLIVYTTKQGGRGALMTTTVDGKIKAQLAIPSSDVREPAWGPYQR